MPNLETKGACLIKRQSLPERAYRGIRLNEWQAAHADNAHAGYSIPNADKLNGYLAAEGLFEASRQLRVLGQIRLVDVVCKRDLFVVVAREQADFVQHPG